MDEEKIALGLDLLGAGIGLRRSSRRGGSPRRPRAPTSPLPSAAAHSGMTTTAANAQPGGVPGHGQRGVAGAGGHDARRAPPTRAGAGGGGAALLEGARHLKVSSLTKTASRSERQGLRVGARRGGDGAAESRPAAARMSASVVGRAARGHGGAITCRRMVTGARSAMKGVELRPGRAAFQSTPMRPPWPRPSSTAR